MRGVVHVADHSETLSGDWRTAVPMVGRVLRACGPRSMRTYEHAST